MVNLGMSVFIFCLYLPVVQTLMRVLPFQYVVVLPVARWQTTTYTIPAIILYYTIPSQSIIATYRICQEWKHQLRTSLHPALFAGFYLIADFISSHILPIGILRAAILVAAPKALQAVIAGLGDWYTWQLAVSIYGANCNVSFFAVSYISKFPGHRLT